MRAAPRWRSAFGVRAALLAVLAQAIIPIVHHVYHGYPPTIASIVAAGGVADRTQSGRHEHDPARKDSPPPVPDNRTPICPVCQSAQQLTGTLPPAAEVILVPSRRGEVIPTPRDSAVIVARPYSSAQPRAPPPVA
jgi:hypothetical protein